MSRASGMGRAGRIPRHRPGGHSRRSGGLCYERRHSKSLVGMHPRDSGDGCGLHECAGAPVIARGAAGPAGRRERGHERPGPASGGGEAVGGGRGASLLLQRRGGPGECAPSPCHAGPGRAFAAGPGDNQNLLTDPHAPGRFRAHGSLSNLPAFADAFQCTAGSRMARPNTCEVW
ncbi:hypothetical protein JY651_18400 [Pyxidicoccus parkwayensis]|uniref:Peptidase M13 C-terminal domain-containing protein n=1 Tax=Pyxidicoccus parkwayensis TaxID=2813578 RepID=A0ABX7PCQ3_9BACT|nr:hypothetical protein JY651_18400 [Pyxidicoccus parkwaysis]